MADWLIHITRLFVKTVALFFALIFGVTGIAMLVAVVGGRPVMAVVERLPSAISSVAPIYFGAFFIIIPVAVALAIGALSAFLILTGRPKGELLASLITSDGQSLLEYRVCNAIIEEAVPNEAFQAVARAVGAAKSANMALALIGRESGGLWVGGRIFLTTKRIVFVPNAINAALTANIFSVSIDLPNIVDVRWRKSLLGSIVDICTLSSTLTARGYRMKAFARSVEYARVRRLH